MIGGVILIINKYVKKIPINSDKVCLYNSLNGSIIELEKDYMDGDNLIQNKFSEEEKLFLKKSEFLNINEFEKNHEILKSYNRVTNSLDITIELTLRCNIKCSYCYQDKLIDRNIISLSTIDKILNYIEEITSKREIKYLKLTYIGGEPLLAKEELRYSYDKISDYCKKNDISLITSLNTNATLLNKGDLNYFEDIEVPVTLSLPNDHDLVRGRKDGGGTFNTIIKNLIDNKDFFKRSDVNLVIRYNTNVSNIKYFGEFLDYLNTLDLDIIEVYAMYTDEYPHNDFMNGLSMNEFLVWNSTIAIDELIKRGYKIYFKPKSTYMPCKAYIDDNCKFYSDGFTGLCDAWDYEFKGPHIDQLLGNSQLLNDYFKDIRRWNPFDDIDCKDCKNLILCGGKYFCRNNCDYENRYILNLFIKKYIEYLGLGKGYYFPQMVS